MSSVLTDLKAALEAKREAEAALRVAAPKYKDLVLGRAWTNRRDDLYDLLTDDTIRALLDVAEAVEAIYVDDDDDWHRVWVRVPEAKAAIAPLVKEADHDRA